MDPLEDVIILQLLKYAIAFVALVGAWFHFLGITRLKGTGRAWITWGFALILLYWAFYYIQSILGALVLSHQIWVRVGVFLVCSLITACGVEAWKRGK